MKTILAIFAIACTALLFALRDGDPPPDDAGAAPIVAVPLADGFKSDDSKDRVNESGPVTAASGDRSVGETSDMLRMASERLERHDSVAALVRYRIHLFESELIGSGLYQQAGQGSGRRFRLELKTQLGDKLAGRLQVCDGNTLWTYRELPTGAQIERLDLRRVRAAKKQAAKLPATSPIEELSTGGLPKLLDGLRESFRQVSAEAGYLGDVPMWAIELEWKPAVLAALVPEKKERIEAGEACDFSELPQLPARVLVYLGHEDLFPRRIEFRRRAFGSAAAGGEGQGRGDDLATAVVVEFSEVRFNEPIDPRQFEYGAAGATDVTDAFLQSRGLPVVR